MRRFIAPAAACAAVVFAACSADAKDYEEEGEKYIEGDEFSEETGASFSNADCQQPASTDEGTIYTCSAEGDDGTIYTIEIEITGENELTVTKLTPGAAPVGDTTAAGESGAPTTTVATTTVASPTTAA